MKKYLFILFSFISIVAYSREKGVEEIYPVAFYNLENLFDTTRDLTIQDEDFTPGGKYHWTEDKYLKKLNNLSYVIAQLGKDSNPQGFAILGVAEVENRKVMEDLIHTGKLTQTNYQIVHKDSPDTRGIDVGLIYHPDLFKLSSFKTYSFTIPGRGKSRTRDVLVVSGKLGGEPVSVLVNHWVSRRGANSEGARERCAKICKHISDSIYRENPAAGIIIMGDLNDNPSDKSTRVVLGARKYYEDVRVGGFYNTMWKVYDKGIGSLRYKNKWDLFDQIIISESLLRKGASKLSYIRSYVFNKKFLFQHSGRFKGYPLRTFSGTVFLNGYSDHFPTLIYLKKE